jgi:hypothetical protein
MKNPNHKHLTLFGGTIRGRKGPKKTHNHAIIKKLIQYEPQCKKENCGS